MSPLTYVYCLVRGARQPALRDLPPGMPGSSGVRALDAGGGLWAIVATVPATSYDADALAGGLQNLEWVGACAMAHESVVEHFLTARGLLPLQLFTLFTSDERALQYIRRDRSRIDRVLARVSGHLEWGLRLSFDEQAARAAVDAKHASPPGGADASAGAGYLARKRDLLQVSRTQLAAAKREADRLYQAMTREAVESRRRTATEEGTPGSRLLLDAAFLVPSRRAGAFRAALRQAARRLTAAGLVVSLTGPWPAYNFVSPAGRARSASKAAGKADPSDRTPARARARVPRSESAARRRPRRAAEARR